MEIVFITLMVSSLTPMYSAQALNCYNCPLGTTLSGCVTGHTIQSCSVDTGFDQCLTLTTFVTNSKGQNVTYLEKQCGLAFICNNPDPSFICNSKGKTLTEQGQVMHNCIWRCCNTDKCNNDYLSLPAPPSPAPSVNSSIAAVNGSAIVVPSTPESRSPGRSTPGCGAGSINKPLRMSIAFVAIYHLASVSFKTF